MTDPFAHDDAAYVLGALDPAEHAAFEAHLATCPECRTRVGEARATLALLGPCDELAGLDADLELDAAGAPPDTLLPGVLRRARREQRRRRGVTAALAAVAAACLVALVVAVWPGRATEPHPQALRPVQPVSFVTATAALRPRPWGTEIDVRCKYKEALQDSDAHAYGLRVVDRDGSSHDAGTWTISGHQTVVFTGGTEVRRERIAKVQVTLPDGTPVLQLTL